MNLRTIGDLFYDSVSRYQKPDHLRFKKNGVWHDVSSDEYRRAVEEASMGLRELAIERGDRVAILSENRPEWAYADLAVILAGGIDVPIYVTLTPPQIAYILNDSGARAIFVSSAELAAKVNAVRAQVPTLAQVIVMDDVPVPGCLSFADLRRQGAAALASVPDAVRQRAVKSQPDDLATIIYTSGTTGDPKGVMLTHDNLMANVDAVRDIVVGSSRVDLQACKLEYSIVSPK